MDMDMRKVYSISLKDEKIINYLEKIPNKSQYIKELIQRDMKKKPFTKEQVTYIRKMIDEKIVERVVRNEDDEQRLETARALDEFMNDL